MKLHIVPARTGATWVKLGIKTFWRQPLAMAALFFLTMAIMSTVAALIPLLGTVIALMLLPSSSLVMMIAANEAAQGHFPSPKILIAAFRTGRQSLRDMAVLGGLYAAIFLLAIGSSVLVDGGDFAQVYLGGMPLSQELAQSESFQYAMWYAMALYLPLSMMFWHAPALVHWHGVSPVKSMFFSLVACWRNLGAYLVYGLSWLGVFLIGGLFIGLLASLPLGEDMVTTSGGILVAIAMLMAAMFFTSIVFTFRDCFSAPENTEKPHALTGEHLP